MKIVNNEIEKVIKICLPVGDTQYKIVECMLYYVYKLLARIRCVKPGSFLELL